MPELPDVEGFRRHFVRYAQGRRVGAVHVRDPALVRNTSAQGLGRAIAGRRFEQPRRIGKWLIAPAGGPGVVMHFGMTGRLSWIGHRAGAAIGTGGEVHPHDRVIFELDDGELRYRDMRKFGGVWLLREGADLEEITGPLGPDAMSVDREALAALLGGRRGQIKAALMDQRVIAGIGNLLSDEVLWRARIHPSRPARELSPRAVGALDRELQATIAACNRRGRIPRDDGWLTGARDARDGRCPRCGTRLRRATVAGRTACWCPRCQRAR